MKKNPQIGLRESVFRNFIILFSLFSSSIIFLAFFHFLSINFLFLSPPPPPPCLSSPPQLAPRFLFCFVLFYFVFFFCSSPRLQHLLVNLDLDPHFTLELFETGSGSKLSLTNKARKLFMDLKIIELVFEIPIFCLPTEFVE